jgi:L-threonylcarbamoyladenylate synthase
VAVSEQERALRAGGLAIVPTDTVYGIGCAAYHRDACRRLYAVKARPREQPTALMLGSVDNLLEHVLPELLGRIGVLCRRVLPGPLTLVVPNPGRRFAYLCGDTPEKIGVRVPHLPAGSLRSPMQSAASRSRARTSAASRRRPGSRTCP